MRIHLPVGAGRRALVVAVLAFAILWVLILLPTDLLGSGAPLPQPLGDFRVAAWDERPPAPATPIRAVPGGMLYYLPCAGGDQPLPVGELIMVRHHGGPLAELSNEPARWSRPRSVRTLWTDGEFALLLPLAAGAIDAIAAEGYSVESLRDRVPARGSASRALRDAGRAASTAFEPIIGAVAQRVDPDSFYARLAEFCGATPATVGAFPYVFDTRYTHTESCRKAEQWCYETLSGFGLQTSYESFQVGPTVARNVIGEMPGVVTPQRIYIIGGHLDSTSEQPWTLAPGAEDNGSGAIGVIEAARVLKDYAFDSTIRFICFSGEEQGLYGSTKNAGDAAARGDSIFGVVNFDMIGWIGTTYAIIIEGETPWDSLMSVMEDACAQFTPLATQKSYFSWGSDHVPYQENGYAAFLAIEDEYDDYPGYHSSGDTLGNVSGDHAADVIRAAVATTAHLAHPSDATLVSGTRIGSSPLAGTPLGAAVPNPFREMTTIRFRLERRCVIDLSVHDASGRFVTRLCDGEHPEGWHCVCWDGRDAAGRAVGPAPYFYELRAGAERWVGRVTLLR